MNISILFIFFLPFFLSPFCHKHNSRSIWCMWIIYIQYPSDTRYFFVQKHSLHVWTHSLNSLDAFDRCMKRIRTKSQTCSSEKPNAFKREAKCIRTRKKSHSNEKLNTLEQEAKCIWTRNRTCLLNVWNVLKRDSKRLLIASSTHSNKILDSFP